MDTSPIPETAVEHYSLTHPNSGQLYAAALKVFPSGVTHDNRFLRPFPIYVNRAMGSRKYDVDGKEYVDYAMGHGALLLGHGHPAIVEAITQQAAKGTHWGACHELEIEWGQLVQRLFPSAERVRFTASGTEATMLAIRLARAWTKRTRVLKFEGHFHGWHDYLAPAIRPPFDRRSIAGIPDGVVDLLVVAPANDLAGLERILSEDKDIAAVILEPSGAGWGTIPLQTDFLLGLPTLTQKFGNVLIFDEVITGFRWSPGGIQALYNLRPDLTCLAKILAGGLPGGAVAGRVDIMSLLDMERGGQDNLARPPHHGTFNANPLSAAAGIAILQIASTGEPQRVADRLAAQLRMEMNAIIDRRGAPGCVYGESSVFHIFLGQCPKRGKCDRSLCSHSPSALRGLPSPLSHALRRSLLDGGVDLLGSGGMLSAAHTQEDVERTVRALEMTVDALSAEGLLGG
ncbi:MAG: aspartate aminotransferase family protein [Chloroflexi bacterium]|nr:aspartate aminotransferase family protein [Chloroflexota bacterium]MCL5075673.1 aspartate aminotransferase family protein [Chloroflexota bacterium]